MQRLGCARWISNFASSRSPSVLHQPAAWGASEPAPTEAMQDGRLLLLPPAVRRLVRRLRGEPEFVGLRLNCLGGAAEVQAHDARWRVLPDLLLELRHV